MLASLGDRDFGKRLGVDVQLGIVSTEFVGFDSRHHRAAYETRRLTETAADLGISVTWIDPSKISISLGGNTGMAVEYYPEPRRIFYDLDALLVKRARTMTEQVSDLVKALDWLIPGLSIFDPPGSYENVTSKITSLIDREKAGLLHPVTRIGLGSNMTARDLGLKLPVLWKPSHGTQAMGISEVRDLHMLDRLIQQTRNQSSEAGDAEGSNLVLVQELIDFDNEYRVFVVGDTPLGMARRYREAGPAFRRGELPQAHFEACEQIPEVLDLGVRARRAHGYSFIGVDVVEKNGEFYILEANRNPQFSQFERVTGIDVARHMVEHIMTQSTNAG